MNRFLSILALFTCVFLSACRTGHDKAQPAGPDRQRPAPLSGKVALVAFRGTDSAMLAALQLAWKQEWTPEMELVRVGAEPASAWYPERRRWVADSILVWLDQLNGGRYLKMAAVTVHDISTRKNGQANWGVLGLGSCPGRSCVVSAYRAKPGVTDFRKLALRMRSLLFHEVGHTFGLPHCDTAGCIMEDAKGKMTLDGEKGFCRACRKRLLDMGLLRNR